MRRGLLVTLVVVGLALAAAPVAFGMFGRAPKGAVMLDDFRPFMTRTRIERFQSYMREIDAAMRESDHRLRPYLARHAGIDQRQFDTRFGTFTSFMKEWPRIRADMTDLLQRVHANLGNYRAVAALPSFTLFPWFFVVPGVLIAALGAAALARPRVGGVTLWVIVAVGAALVAAPFAFRMFERAPKGGHMMDDFRSLETRPRVRTMQGYFGSMSVGQGAIRLGLIPAAQREAGLDDAQLERQFPAVVAIDRDWIRIINDMTPMIGAMSDNVDNYQAITALPPFPLFPWFFVAPGGAVVLLALIAFRRPRAGRPGGDRSPPPAEIHVSAREEGTPAISTPHRFGTGAAALAFTRATRRRAGCDHRSW